ncbi:CocE/NonD family hydrolase [Roseomonas sp. F4]
MTPETLSMRTRDGVRLDADVWRPTTPGPHPVLLMRQPYGRRIASTVVFAHPAWYAAQGYIVVIQDVRGSGTSEGDFLAYDREAGDGADAIAWAAALPGADGQVAMYGFSYQGATQLLALSQGPAALRVMSPAMASWDLYGEKARDKGAFLLAGNAFWAAQMGAAQARRAGDAAAYAELAAAGPEMLAGPVPAAPAVLQKHVGLHHYTTWRDAPAEDGYWQRASPAQALGAARPDVPALWVGGWFDYHLDGTLAGYRALSQGGADHWLMIGPWPHLAWSPVGAGTDFGPAALSDVDALQVALFDHVLKSAPLTGWMAESRVRLFDLGLRAWRGFAALPEPAMRPLFLAGDGRAAVRDGGLTAAAPEAAQWEYVTHDPWRPVPALGLHHGGAAWRDRAEVDARFDVLTFTTDPLTAPLDLVGEPELVAEIRANAPGFDVNATLSLVTAQGRSFALSQAHAVLTDGMVRLKLRALCITLTPGDRLRLSLAGACFPAYPVNPGTGTDPRHATGAEARPITLSVCCGGAAPARLLLPVLSGAAVGPA